MQTNALIWLKTAARIAALLVSVAVLPSCDPAALDPETRRSVTGTSDVGDITLSVAPTEAEVGGTPVEITYTLRYLDFSGGDFYLAVDLAGADVQLVTDVQARQTPSVLPHGVLSGTFSIRAIGAAAGPADIFLRLTSVGTAGSRVEHPPARVRLTLTPTAPSARLDLDCTRRPDSGAAPLKVSFEANPSGCRVRCGFSWDFGDGNSSEQWREVHEYVEPGEYVAVATLEDGGGGRATCERTIRVSRPEKPAPTPTTPGG
jgi:hypothetical protein